MRITDPVLIASLEKQIAEAKARRLALMPTENEAISIFFDAHQRLKELGWQEAIYCPKDGSTFHVIEPGSTGIHVASYQGEWPDGSWWVHCEDGDMCPSHPCLWKPIGQASRAQDEGKA